MFLLSHQTTLHILIRQALMKFKRYAKMQVKLQQISFSKVKSQKFKLGQNPTYLPQFQLCLPSTKKLASETVKRNCKTTLLKPFLCSDSIKDANLRTTLHIHNAQQEERIKAVNSIFRIKIYILALRTSPPTVKLHQITSQKQHRRQCLNWACLLLKLTILFVGYKF